MVTTKRFLYRRTWLDARRNWLGASDTPAILGVGYSKQGPSSVYFSKVNEVEENQTKVSSRFRIALAVEPVYIRLAGEELGVEIVHNSYGKEGTTVWISQDCDYMAATPDGVIGENTPVEIKDIGQHNRHEWEDGETPLMYQVQQQHQMDCMGAERGLLIGCIGKESFEFRWLDRDEPFIERMRAALGDFWERVKTKTPPPVDASEACSDALKQLYPDGEDFAVTLPEAVDHWIAKREEAHEAEKAAEGRKKALDNRLRSYLKQAMFGITPRGACVKLGEVKVKAKTCPHCERELKAPYKYRKLSWPKKLPQGMDLRTAGPIELAQDLELEEWLAQD